jgi:hypothetical protein
MAGNAVKNGARLYDSDNTGLKPINNTFVPYFALDKFVFRLD